MFTLTQEEKMRYRLFTLRKTIKMPEHYLEINKIYTEMAEIEKQLGIDSLAEKHRKMAMREQIPARMRLAEVLLREPVPRSYQEAAKIEEEIGRKADAKRYLRLAKTYENMPGDLVEKAIYMAKRRMDCTAIMQELILTYRTIPNLAAAIKDDRLFFSVVQSMKFEFPYLDDMSTSMMKTYAMLFEKKCPKKAIELYRKAMNWNTEARGTLFAEVALECGDPIIARNCQSLAAALGAIRLPSDNFGIAKAYFENNFIAEAFAFCNKTAKTVTDMRQWVLDHQQDAFLMHAVLGYHMKKRGSAVWVELAKAREDTKAKTRRGLLYAMVGFMMPFPNPFGAIGLTFPKKIEKKTAKGPAPKKTTKPQRKIGEKVSRTPMRGSGRGLMRGNGRGGRTIAMRGNGRGGRTIAMRRNGRGLVRAPMRGNGRGGRTIAMRGSGRGLMRAPMRGNGRGAMRGSGRGLMRGSGRGLMRGNGRGLMRAPMRESTRGLMRAPMRGGRGAMRGNGRGLMRGGRGGRGAMRGFSGAVGKNVTYRQNQGDRVQQPRREMHQQMPQQMPQRPKQQPRQEVRGRGNQMRQQQPRQEVRGRGGNRVRSPIRSPVRGGRRDPDEWLCDMEGYPRRRNMLMTLPGDN